MALYLGIDAGGTKTDCAVSNGAELLGHATGASCKLARVGREKARENLQTVIRQACEAARVAPNDVQHVCIGMAGASLAEAVQRAQATIRELIPDSTIYVAGDHVIAHRGTQLQGNALGIDVSNTRTRPSSGLWSLLVQTQTQQLRSSHRCRSPIVPYR